MTIGGKCWSKNLAFSTESAKTRCPIPGFNLSGGRTNRDLRGPAMLEKTGTEPEPNHPGRPLSNPLHFAPKKAPKGASPARREQNALPYAPEDAILPGPRPTSPLDAE
jgi:hypothetical protein